VRPTLSLAALLVAAAAASSARADDSPGLALAKRAVDEARGEGHKAEMRIVWPAEIDATPPEGAEVTVITGYICYEMTRLVWRDGKVAARSVATARTWFYNPDGEAFAAREFDVEPAAFANAWAAARFVVGARDERIGPKPEGLPSGIFGFGSHESREWVRLRDPGDETPLHVGSPFGSRSQAGIRPWDEIRDRSVFRLFAPLLPRDVAARPVSVGASVPAVVDEIRRATRRLDLRYAGEHHLLLEVCLRLAGEFGDAAALDAVRALGASLDAAKGGDASVVGDLRDEIASATTKLRLRTDWSAEHAARFLRSSTHERTWQRDLDKWVRALFLAKAPHGYRAFLASEGVGADQEPAALEASLAALKKADAAAAKKAIEALLADSRPDVRIAAARAALAVDARDAAAAATLVVIADDRTIADVRSRAWALRSAKQFEALHNADLARRLGDPRPEHARVVETLIELARYSEPALSQDVVLSAWRRVCDGPVELGVATAVDQLLDLRDAPSKERLLAAIDRLEAAVQAKAAAVEELDAEKLARLRKRVAEELGDAAPPK
jgi:hypothetical protein